MGKREIKKPPKDWLEILEKALAIINHITAIAFIIYQIFKG